MIDVHWISALGTGWAPAVLDREKELRFIIEGDRGLRNISSYWIGGSTYLQPNYTIQYSEYYNIGSGSICSFVKYLVLYQSSLHMMQHYCWVIVIQQAAIKCVSCVIVMKY